MHAHGPANELGGHDRARNLLIDAAPGVRHIGQARRALRAAVIAARILGQALCVHGVPTAREHGRLSARVHVLEAYGTATLESAVCASVRVANGMRKARLAALAVEKICRASDAANAAGRAVVGLFAEISVK